jgi:hypothetical protein
MDGGQAQTWPAAQQEAPNGIFLRTYIVPGGRPRDYCPSPVKERLMAKEEMADLLYDHLAEVLDMNSWPDSYYDMFHSANLVYKGRLKKKWLPSCGPMVCRWIRPSSGLL